uniref:ATP-binding cassette domain-containing protein n=1 Tax=uncultured Fretibacterium sp. TaxID=1678694 RepID=UPI00262AA617
MGMESGSNIVIEVQDMQYAYPDGTLALKGISLKIGRGEFVALLGQNGAGKTTFAKTLNGLLKPVSGYVKVDGIDTREPHVVKKLVQK